MEATMAFLKECGRSIEDKDIKPVPSGASLDLFEWGGGVCKLILQSYQRKFCRVTFAESLRELIFLFPKLLLE
jgi:hypothetical protein